MERVSTYGAIGKAEYDELIARLKAEHKGEIYELAVDDESGLVAIMRKPGRPDFSKFAKDVATDAYRAQNNLFFGCLLHPSADVFKDAFEKDPGLAMAFGNKLLTMAKVNVEVLEKKL
jgi:hypothetical protein